ncbi:UNVERIFIED_CONTAM: hypothetical protein FKN15_012650 [Acipenser sinensis]
MAKFHAPVIQDNLLGWGPCAIPEQFKDMPYQPFSKGDRLGKLCAERRSQVLCDSPCSAPCCSAVCRTQEMPDKYSSQFGGGSQYAYFHEEDETSFQLVDTAKTQKTAYQRNRMRFAQAQLKPRDSSVEVRSDWEVKEEMDFPRLMKMRYMEVDDPSDIECCGALEYYDKAFDRVTTRNEKPLKSIKRIFHTVTTTDDPVIRKLAKTQGNVFATDAILATLMCCTRSVYSWDIIVQRVGNKLFFDKRDNSDFDLLTVSETANEPPQDEGNSFNSPRNLAMEATYINHNFSQQCLKMGGEKYKFPNSNPFVEEDVDKSEVASVGYRVAQHRRPQLYRLFQITLSAVDFTQHCNGVDWRQKLDSQRGAVLATELKNNSYKLARWTCCAMLAGSEYLKLGYVSRYHVKDSARHVILGTQQFKPNEFASQINLSMENAWGILRCVIDTSLHYVSRYHVKDSARHVILGTQQFKPNEFASQINLSMENAWGILRCVIDTCMKLEEGKYLILKDPNKQVIRAYSLPDGTFSSDEDEDEEEEEEDEEDDGESEGRCNSWAYTVLICSCDQKFSITL